MWTRFFCNFFFRLFFIKEISADFKISSKIPQNKLYKQNTSKIIIMLCSLKKVLRNCSPLLKIAKESLYTWLLLILALNTCQIGLMTIIFSHTRFSYIYIYIWQYLWYNATDSNFRWFLRNNQNVSCWPWKFFRRIY